jgi:hypothetical protein
MLLAGEALLLSGGHDFPISYKACSGIVVVGRNPEDVHRYL